MDYIDYALEDFLKDELFVKWVQNPTPEQSFFWESWLSKHPEKVALVYKAKEIINAVEYAHVHEPPEELYLQVLEQVLKKSERRWVRPALHQPAKVYTWLRWVASVALLVTVGLGSWWIHQRENILPDPEVRELVTKIIPKGKKVSLILTDGTRIKLNSESKISFPKYFDAHLREVYLEGEAFFEVERDTARPFVVHAKGVDTRVLGTSFNLRAYPEQRQVNVTVATGKVAVYNTVKNPGDHPQSLLVLPSEMAIAGGAGKLLTKRPVDIQQVIAWKNDILLFSKNSFEEVLYKLERWYGVEFVLAPQLTPVGNWSGEFQNSSLEFVLEGLGFSSDFQFEIEGKKVRVSPK
ncbi:FecR domain-containing protein [Rapidithrix thailandica]|uniref:FecR domain-containing protein n=1 Tax=Rapidithrix thailandica TaxID=413964 RepID=A0AAW9S2F6_9BACT